MAAAKATSAPYLERFIFGSRTNWIDGQEAQ